MTNEQLKKLVSFEGIMFLTLCFFWGGAMFLPLFLTGAINNKAFFWNNAFIILGPYSVYVVIRLLIAFVRSVRWAYLVSNFFFRSERERRLAQEWFRFVCLGPAWAAITAYPLYAMGLFSSPKKVFLSILLMVTPYSGYLLFKFLILFLKSAGWELEISKKK